MSEQSISWVQEQARLGAVRWLHQIDLNPHSPTYGVADREYWSWKTKDFANGTWQGGIAGVLDTRNLLALSEAQLQHLVKATLTGTRFIQRSNGSFEEAYPYESSYAVTALVIFNLLYSRYCHSEYFGEEENEILTEIISAGSRFLERTPETHGLIANHLATGDLALWLSHDFLKKKNSREAAPFLSLQTSEGWFPEYGGADPGYQTLLNHYVVAAHRALTLPEPFQLALENSQNFLKHFCMPNGSFAGEIGSRGTSIVYPGGLWDKHFKASPLAVWFLKRHAGYIGSVWPTSSDPGNFVPIFNSWALAYQLMSKDITNAMEPDFFPPQKDTSYFPEAKLICLKSPSAHLLVSLKNGAIRKCLKSNQGAEDMSRIASYALVEHDFNQERILLKFRENFIPRMLNSPWRSSLLRALAILFYFFPSIQRMLKRFLSYVVMNRKGGLKSGRLELAIDLTHDDLPIKLMTVENKNSLSPFGFQQHMASANTFEPRAL